MPPQVPLSPSHRRHEDGRQVETRVYRDHARTIINPVSSPDLSSS